MGEIQIIKKKKVLTGKSEGKLPTAIIITQPTNALIVCHLFLNNFFKTRSLLLNVSIAYRLSSSGSTYSS